MRKPYELETDELLMKRYQNGDAEAFNELFRRYAKKIYTYLKRRIYNRVDLEDAFQNVFMKIHKHRAHYDPSLPPGPWIYTITKNVSLNYQKQRVARSLESTNAEQAHQHYSQVAPSLEGPDLSILSEKCRTAIELRFYEDLSFDEMARRLQVTPQNARKIVSRSIRKLKAALDLSRKP